MRWEDSVAELVQDYRDPGLVPEASAQRAAWAFFEQEVYFRFARLATQFREQGIEVMLSPASGPPEGSTWKLDLVELRILGSEREGGHFAPLAMLQVRYDRALLCSTEHHTHQGRIHQSVFSLAGTPVDHLEAVVRDCSEEFSRSRA